MDKLQELINRKNEITNFTVNSDSGSMTARERINLLFDSGSFIETDMFSGRSEENIEEGVITGYGTVDSRAVFVYAQDISKDGGAFGAEQAKKIKKVLDMAKNSGSPCVALLDSSGVKLDDGIEALAAMGEIYARYAEASGSILTISAVFGKCAGGAAIVPELSDFVIMTEKSRLMLNGAAVCSSEGHKVSEEDMASAEVNAKLNGNADFIAQDDRAAVLKIRELITILPGNSIEHVPETVCNDDLNRLSGSLGAEGLTTEDVIKEIADNGEVLLTSRVNSESVITGFIKINGRTVSVAANSGELDLAACRKISKIIKFSDAFNIPVLTLCNTYGFKASADEEKAGLLKSVSKLAMAYADATIPMVTVITGGACTSAGVVLGSRAVGADFVLAWPNAVIGAVSPDMAGVLFYGKNGLTDKDSIKEDYINNQADALSAAKTGFIDDVIEPDSTRPRVAAAFEMLYGKGKRSSKKHSSLSL